MMKWDGGNDDDDDGGNDNEEMILLLMVVVVAKALHLWQRHCWCEDGDDHGIEW